MFLLLFLSANAARAQKTGIVEILGADRLLFDEKQVNAQRLIGNVRVRHEGVDMFCDSARFFPGKNMLYAYGRIHVKQGDSLNVYGDSLIYDGNSRLAKLRGSIRVIENDLKMETDSVDFDVAQGQVFYRRDAQIISTKNNNTLSSKSGIYDSGNKTLLFSDSVVLKHPEYTIHSDTLIYHPETDLAEFAGSTVIRHDQATIYCEGGYYDTKADKAEFRKRAFFQKEEYFLHADTIFYDRLEGVGIARGNINFLDTLNNFILRGQFGELLEKEDQLTITKRPLLVKPLEKDSLYVSADTLFTRKEPVDSLRRIEAYHTVRIFKTDVQGICDSLAYSDEDSTMRLFGLPVLWNEENQLTAELIEVKIRGEELDTAFLEGNAFLASRKDTIGFNQINGKRMIGKFNDGKMDHLKVLGNGQTIYYAGEEGKKAFGMNHSVSSTILIQLDGKKLKSITMEGAPDASLKPLKETNPKDMILKGFRWEEKKRPMNLEDLLIPKIQ